MRKRESFAIVVINPTSPTPQKTSVTSDKNGQSIIIQPQADHLPSDVGGKTYPSIIHKIERLS